jgi:ribosome maturation factor RimP
MSDLMTASQADIERRLAQTDPDVEVLLVEVLPSKCLRVFIDHPDGVTLALCERVSMRLNDLRELYALEVSSPGSRRPLTKPAHFRRFLGRRARVRTYRPRPVTAGQEANLNPLDCGSADPSGPAEGRPSDPRRLPSAAPRRRSGRGRAADRQSPASSRSSGSSAADGRTSFTGELVAASEDEVTLAAAGGVIAIPYAEIRRSNLLEE